MNKIFFFDLDGTLLNSEKKITPDTYHALEKWHEAGNLLCISSGRPMVSIEKVIKEQALERFFPYAIAFNGGLVKKYGCDTPLLKNSISGEMLKAIAHAAADLDLYVHCYSDTHILAKGFTRELEFYTRVVKVPYRIVDPYPEGIEGDSCKMICIDLDESGRQKLLAKEIEALSGGSVTTQMSNPWYMEIIPSTSGKGAAVSFLTDHLGISRKDSFAAGDEQNDISMLKAAGTGAAPANATADTKAAADLVLDEDNDHDAFAKVLLENM